MAGSGFDDSNPSNLHAAFITVTGPIWTPLHFTGDKTFTATIPDGIAGQSYVVITKGKTKVTDDNIVAGPAIIEVSQIYPLSHFKVERVCETNIGFR